MTGMHQPCEPDRPPVSFRAAQRTTPELIHGLRACVEGFGEVHRNFVRLAQRHRGIVLDPHKEFRFIAEIVKGADDMADELEKRLLSRDQIHLAQTIAETWPSGRVCAAAPPAQRPPWIQTMITGLPFIEMLGSLLCAYLFAFSVLLWNPVVVTNGFIAAVLTMTIGGCVFGHAATRLACDFFSNYRKGSS